MMADVGRSDEADVPGVAALRAAIGMLGDVDPDGLTDAELHAVVVAVEKLRAGLGIAAGRLVIGA